MGKRKEGPSRHGAVPMPMRVGGQRGNRERRCRDLHRQLPASLIEGPAENDQSGARQRDNSSQLSLASYSAWLSVASWLVACLVWLSLAAE